MNGSYLLDTNIVIGLFANDTNIVEQIQKASRAAIPSIVIGELYYGAYNSTKIEANVSKIEQFSQDTEILICDTETAAYYGQIKSLLKQKGKPIPENDIWIAASAKRYRLTLVSRDKHFAEIDGLDWIDW